MLISGRKDEDPAADMIDIPKRTTPAKGKGRSLNMLYISYCSEKL